MPDHRDFQSNASPVNLEEAMGRLKVEDDDKEGMDANRYPYPDRPEAPDCIFYLRTGLCGYGSNCRYNHPTSNAQGAQERGELPERVGQPECQYFLKTGTCKYGSSCKYHHPRDRYDAPPTPLNMLGFPVRQDEKSCPYYMRTGSCKFGVACKFNHPQPATFGAVFSATGYGSPDSSFTPPSSLPLMGGLSTWPLATSFMTGPRMPGLSAYMPVILPPSQGALPMQQGWSTYTGSASQLQSTSTPSANSHAQSGSRATSNLPERPDQPQCQYYMKTGNCKYGTTCKYHHPKEMYPVSDCPVTLGPLGLPLRPGHDTCTHYSMYGICRYGAACKYDHPLMGFYNYAVPAVSVPNPSALYHSDRRNLPQATWLSTTPETPIANTARSSRRLKNSGHTNGLEAKADSAPIQTTSPSSESHQNQFD